MSDGQGVDLVEVDPLSDQDEGEYPLTCLGLNVASRGASSSCSRFHEGGLLCSLHPAPSAAGVYGETGCFASDGGITSGTTNTTGCWMVRTAAISAYTCCDSCSR